MTRVREIETNVLRKQIGELTDDLYELRAENDMLRDLLDYYAEGRDWRTNLQSKRDRRAGIKNDGNNDDSL